MLVEWKTDDGSINFGDGLSQLLLDGFRKKDKYELIHSEDKVFFLVGSYISDVYINKIKKTQTASFWGCGFRGEAIQSENIDKCRFYGVRGTETKESLSSIGIKTKVIGDTALVLPVIIAKGPKTGKSIFMPHVQDPDKLKYAPEDLGVDEIIQPNVSSTEDVINIVKALSSADFVLAGAMHAGIVAHAYNVPFSFYNYTDPGAKIKYKDFLSAISSSLDPYFAKGIQDAKKWYDTHKSVIKPVSLNKILHAAPYKVKKKWLLKAFMVDIKNAVRGLYERN